MSTAVIITETEIILSGLMMSTEKKQKEGLFFHPDKVAHYKDE